MSLLYMVIAHEEMKLLQLGAMDAICAKQFLENPETPITTTPVSFGGSYSCYSEAQLRLLAENSGIEINATTYAELIGQLRKGIIDKYASHPKNKDVAYYESKISERRKSEPDLYAKFDPEPQAAIPKRPVDRTPNAAKPSAVVARPAGGTTKRVWEIADKVRTDYPSHDAKALRPLIISACEAESINASTAGTQYAKWKNSQSWGTN